MRLLMFGLGGGVGDLPQKGIKEGVFHAHNLDRNAELFPLSFWNILVSSKHSYAQRQNSPTSEALDFS